ncbi:hypothetical protein CRM22_002295 [Opisthorchis felineus]|uniref:Calpain-5 n=1 Tax=Opisthorchis felineus TaxID=147828 RepID=A0A4V3SGE9_OPIFE|nr:hypothetical protein CRM22_002295 [Opisthorchis felineus]TGZ72086.1 hypothetical protein CRM22_002295 [Opisthorchis felineus]
MVLFKTSKEFKGQDYYSLRKQQLSRGVQFVDDEFPTESIQSFGPDVEFKRPNELVDFPCLKASEDYFSLKKGDVENFNILLAFTSLRYCPKLWTKVFVDPSSQDWSKTFPKEHPGIFRVRIWQEGIFLDVTIDDRLPCRNGKLLSTSSSSPTEFWPSILEKAYAKLLGGYENLEHVRLEEVLMDLTGGVTECIGLQTIYSAPAMKHVEFYEKLEEALKEGTLIILCTEPPKEPSTPSPLGFTTQEDSNLFDHFGSPGPMDSRRDDTTGLCARYGYLLTRVCAIPKDTSVFGALRDAFRREGDCPIRARVLRLRCPVTVTGGGGGLGEWTGAYSSNSSEWEVLTLDVRKRFHLTFDSEAEFWIPLDQVLKNMVGAVICLLPDTGIVNLGGRTWELNEHHGAWHGHQAGGSMRYRDSFLNNPQYMFDIASDGEEVLLTLIRKHDRDPLTMAIEPASHALPVGLGLFQVEKNRTTRVHQLSFTRVVYVEAAKPYRTVLIHRILNVGRYVLIPFIEEPLSVSAYLLRLYLPKRTGSRELTLHVPPNGPFDFFYGPFKEAVRLHIHSGSNLLWPDGKNPPSPYCIVTSEDSSVRTVVRNGTSNPVWDDVFVFYRRRPKNVPIVIQVMDRRAIGFDVFLGRHSFKEVELAQRTQQEIALFGRDNKEERSMRMKGSLYVEFHVVDAENLMQI